MNEMSRIPDDEGKVLPQNRSQFTVTYGSSKLHARYCPRLTIPAVTGLDATLYEHVDKATSKVTPGPTRPPGMGHTIHNHLDLSQLNGKRTTWTDSARRHFIISMP